MYVFYSFNRGGYTFSFSSKNIRAVQDFCEIYFLGHRFTKGEKCSDSLWFTIIRVSSFFTIIVPILVGITFLITTALIAITSSDNQKYWEDKILIEERGIPNAQKLKTNLAKGLAKSGIAETSFQTIIISTNKFFDFDGEFFQFTTACSTHSDHLEEADIPEPINPDNTLCIALKSVGIFEDLNQAGILGLQADFYSAVNGHIHCHKNQRNPKYGQAINDTDLFMLNFGKASNRIKELIINGPDE